MFAVSRISCFFPEYQNFRFHMLGENRSRNGKISSLPTSISRQYTSFENQEKSAKFSTGPTMANPGPVLLIVVSTPVNVVSKLKLSKETSSTDLIMINM